MIIPAARRLFKGAQLISSPRLMEPIYLCEITTNREGLNGIRSVLTKRRGKILEEIVINGTPLNLIKVISFMNLIYFIDYLIIYKISTVYASIIYILGIFTSFGIIWIQHSPQISNRRTSIPSMCFRSLGNN